MYSGNKEMLFTNKDRHFARKELPQEPTEETTENPCLEKLNKRQGHGMSKGSEF